MAMINHLFNLYIHTLNHNPHRFNFLYSNTYYKSYEEQAKWCYITFSRNLHQINYIYTTQSWSTWQLHQSIRPAPSTKTREATRLAPHPQEFISPEDNENRMHLWIATWITCILVPLQHIHSLPFTHYSTVSYILPSLGNNFTPIYSI